MFLDTANIAEIKEGLRTGILQGVTTNPTILKKEGKTREQSINDILDLGVEVLFVQVLGTTTEEMLEDYKAIKAIGDKRNTTIHIKVPISFEGLGCVSQIKKEAPDTMILGTAIYSSDQGILGAFAGCDYLAPYVNRMQNNAIDSIGEIAKMVEVIENRGLNTKVLAASFKNANQVVDALVAGAYTCTIPLDIMKAMTEKDVAVNAIRVFNEDGKATL